MGLIIFAVNGFAQVLIFLLIARAICSWFAQMGSTVYRIYQFLSMLTEPMVAPCRKITSRFNTGMLDLSVILAFFLVIIVRDLLVRALLLFA